MVAVNDEHVVKRLRELRDWAEYIVQSLSTDQAYERGKLELLRRMIGNEDLDGACTEARSLLDHLERLVSRTGLAPAGVR